MRTYPDDRIKEVEINFGQMFDDRNNAPRSPQAFLVGSWILCAERIVKMDDGRVCKSMIGEEGVFDLWCCRIQLLHGDQRGHESCDCVFQVLEVVRECSRRG